MLNFTTTTIINDASQFVGTADKLRVTLGPEFKKTGKITFSVNQASKAELAKATIDLSKLKVGTATKFTDTDIYRIEVYIRTSGTAESTYANDWVFKGKPLHLGEFTGKELNATTTPAAFLVSRIKSHTLAMYGEDLLKVSVGANANTLVIEAKNQYQRFMKQTPGSLPGDGVEVQKFEKFDDDKASIYGTGVFEPLTTTGLVTINVGGKEAFGDFAHIVKDLRLPTSENLRWYGVANGDVMGGEPNLDKPNPGSYYSQITVTYEHERGVGQQSILGGIGTSRTTHVFYVVDTAPADAVAADGSKVGAAAGIAKDFIAALVAVGGVRTNVTVPTSKA